MGVETKSKRIGPHDYRVTQLDALAGRKVFVRLVKLLGPAFEDFDLKNAATSIPKVLSKVAGGLSEEDMEFFCDTLAGFTEVAGGEYTQRSPQLASIFAVHFAGKYHELVQWLVFALEVNFGSFFAHALGSGAAATAAPAA